MLSSNSFFPPPATAITVSRSVTAMMACTFLLSASQNSLAISSTSPSSEYFLKITSPSFAGVNLQRIPFTNPHSTAYLFWNYNPSKVVYPPHNTGCLHNQFLLYYILISKKCILIDAEIVFVGNFELYKFHDNSSSLLLLSCSVLL